MFYALFMILMPFICLLALMNYGNSDFDFYTCLENLSNIKFVDSFEIIQDFVKDFTNMKSFKTYEEIFYKIQMNFDEWGSLFKSFSFGDIFKAIPLFFNALGNYLMLIGNSIIFFIEFIVFVFKLLWYCVQYFLSCINNGLSLIFALFIQL